MSASTYEIKVRLDEPLAGRVKSISQRLGLSPAQAAKVMFARFAEAGGFPFDVRVAPSIDWDSPAILHAAVSDGAIVVPSDWDDDADDFSNWDDGADDGFDNGYFGDAYGHFSSN